jgi:predicted nucleic acid-binding protein
MGGPDYRRGRAGRCALLYSEDLQDGAEYDGIRVKNPYA